jgi:hypothetical protein
MVGAYANPHSDEPGLSTDEGDGEGLGTADTACGVAWRRQSTAIRV